MDLTNASQIADRATAVSDSRSRIREYCRQKYGDPPTPPYWAKAVDSEECGTTIAEVNDDSHFAIDLDVTQFRPEELKMSVEDHCLTVQGQQGTMRQNATKQRSFARSWNLPLEGIEEHMSSSISDQGILHIEGPKVVFEQMNKD